MDALRGQVDGRVLADAEPLVSELVSDSVQHAGLAAGELVHVGAAISEGVVRLEIDDPGSGGTIAAREPDLERGGFGLYWSMRSLTPGASRATVTPASGWSSAAGPRRARFRREFGFAR